MSTSGISNKRAFVAAGMVAVGLLMAGGLTHRALGRYLWGQSDKTDIAYITPGTLANVPLEIGDWIGQDVALDPRIVRAADVDDYINRIYRRRGRSDTVGLYVSCGGKVRDLMPHRPEVCYPAAGWVLRDSQTVELDISSQQSPAAKLPCQLHRFFRGGLAAGSVTVLSYYLVDGWYCADLSKIRSRAWRGRRAIRYMAEMQIISPERQFSGQNSAAEIVQQFAAQCAGAIRKVLQEQSAISSIQ